MPPTPEKPQTPHPTRSTALLKTTTSLVIFGNQKALCPLKDANQSMPVQAGLRATTHFNKLQQTPNQPHFIPVIQLQEA